MADEATSVGKIQLDIEIIKSNIYREIAGLDKAFSDSFKNTFNGIGSQMTGFMKSTIGNMANSFKEFSQVGNKSNKQISQSTEEMSMKINHLIHQMDSATNRAEMHRQKLLQLQAEYDRLSKAGLGDSDKGRSLLDKITVAEDRVRKYGDVSDRTRVKIEQLEQSIGNLGQSAENSSKGFKKAEKGAKKTEKSFKSLGDQAGKSTGKVNNFATMITSSFMRVLKRIFILNLIYKAIRGLMNYINGSLKTNNEFSKSLNIIKTNLRVAFQPIYDFILPAINALTKALATATTYIAASISAMFGKTYKQSYDAVKGLDDAKKKMEGYGKATKKTKGALAGFDEINQLDIQDDEEKDGAAAGEFQMTMPDIDTSNTENAFSRLSNIFEGFYNNWGMKDIFAGFKEGLRLINFDSIRDNFKIAFSGLGEIARTYLESLQPVYQAAGQALGTFFKYGIAIAGNIFEPISLGWVNFVENMKGPIQDWIMETSRKMTSGLEDVKVIFEFIGESWLVSLEKFKEPISNIVEDMLTNIASTFMLIGTVFADTFSIITSNIKRFVTENKTEIQKFNDSIMDIFTCALNFVNQIWSDVLGSISTFWNKWGKGIIDGAMRIVTDVGKWMLYLWNDLVKPLWDTALEWLTKIWDESLKGIVEELLGFVGRVGDLIVKLWDFMSPYWEMLLTFVVPHVKNVLTLIIDAVGLFINGVGNLIKNLIKIINGIIDFIVGVFTLDWKRAWEGVKGIFDGIVGALVGVFKGAINGIIAITNSFIRFWNAIELKVPEVNIPLLGKVGGFTIGVPKVPNIPMLARGGIIDQPTLAMVGERGKEAVIPFEDTSFLDALTGSIISAFAQLLPMLQGGNNSSYDENRELVFNIDGTKLVRILLPKINDELIRMGYRPIYQY